MTRAELNRRSFRLIKLNLDEAVNQGKIDFSGLDAPPSKSESPDEFERLVSAAHLSELHDLKEPLVERERFANRAFLGRPEKPNGFDPRPRRMSTCRVLPPRSPREPGRAIGLA